MSDTKPRSVAISVDRLVVVDLDQDLPYGEAIGVALLEGAAQFREIMDRYQRDPDGETLIALEEYDD